MLNAKILIHDQLFLFGGVVEEIWHDFLSYDY